MKPLRIALTKGRLEKTTIELLEKIGYNCDEVKNKGRRLILPIGNNDENGSSFYELLDLGFGKCRFALATKKDSDFYGGYKTKTIASKYPNVTRAFFDDKNMDVRIIKIEGSVELAPLVGLADGIVDIVETGSTLKANGLEVIEWVCDISARLIANTASLKLRKAEIEELQKKLEAVTK